MSSVEDWSVAEFEQTTKNEITQKNFVYSREILLSFALLDVSWRLPEGCDLLVLSELNEAQNGIHEPWKGSGLPSSSSSGCIIHSTISQSHCNSYMDRKSNGHSTWLNKDRNSSEIHDPDTGGYRKPTQPSLNIAGCKAEVMGKNVSDTVKTGIYLLSKSENPYRPPHSYKVESTTFETKSNAEKTSCTAELYSIDEVVTQSQENTKMDTISNDDKQDIEHSSKEVILASAAPVKEAMPSCHASNFQAFLKEANMICNEEYSRKVNGEPTSNSEAALEEIKYLDSEKLNLSICIGKFDEEHLRKVKAEPSSRSSSESNNFSSSSIEKALPQCLAGTCGFENNISGELSSVRLKGSSSNSHEGSVENPEVDQPNKPTADTYLDDPHCERKLYSGLRGPLNRIARTDISKPYEFLIPIGYDFFDSVLRENTQTWINGMCVMDEDQLDFDDMWSDISAIIRFDQQMELYETDDFGIQVSLSKDDSSNDYPPVAKELALVPPDNNKGLKGIDDDDDDIHLPDEDSLITVEDLLQPNFSKSMESSLKADDSLIDEKQPRTQVMTYHEKGSSILGQDIPPPFPDVRASMGYWDPYGSLEMPAFQPYLSLESPMLLPTTFFDPIVTYQYPVLHQYCYTNMLHRPMRRKATAKSKGRNSLVQPSVSQQPATLSLQNQHLLLYGAPTDPVKELAFCNNELDQVTRSFADKPTNRYVW